MLLFSIFFPFFSSFIAGLLGFFVGRRGSAYLTIISIFLCFITSCKHFYKIIYLGKLSSIKLFVWINSGLFICNWAFLFDSLTIVMLIVVTGISFLVHFYSYGYMSDDAHLSRFMSYLSLFTFFMVILVTADNFIQTFVGWEGVGLCSYLLINFWFTRLQANKAAIKAMLVNRVSDFFIIFGLLTIFITFKSIDYSSIFASIHYFNDYFFNFLNFKIKTIDLLCFLLFIGAMGKSAQIILHTWLPDAMEGPTPVSALIHAATMVTAGVFLLARCSPLFEYSPIILNIIVFIGATTAFFAGTVGLTQNDLKKVIAYSTCSQLGYMMFACGVSNYNLGVFHLSNHAFFKALLFLSAGAVIHALSDEQDMRKMGGLKKILPFSYSMFIIGSLALMGFPFLTGFYSKDAILEVSFASYNNIGHFAYWLGTIAALCTAFYSTRLIFLTFIVKTNSFKKIIINAHDPEINMFLPLGILSLGSIFIGYLSKDMFIGLGSNFWLNSIFIFPNNIQMIDAEFLPSFYKLLPLIFSFFGLIFAIYLYHFSYKTLYSFNISYFGLILYNFLNRKWFFDKFYHEIISQKLLNISYFKTYKFIDRGIIELLGPYGISYLVFNFSKYITNFQTGYIYNYSFLILINTISFLFIILFSNFFLLIFIFLIYFILI